MARTDESDTGELDWRVEVVRRARLGAYGSDLATITYVGED